VRDCPTEVFSHDGFSPIDLITLAKGKKVLEFYCQASDSDQMKADCLPLPCHGLLDDRLLVGLHSVGVEQLNLHGLDRCSKCLSREGALRLAQTLERTPATLNVHFPSLHGVSQAGDIFAVSSDDNNSGRKAPMDRRHFLEGTVNSVAYAALSALPVKLLQDQSSENSPVTTDRNECMVKHLPDSHRLACLNLQSGDISTADAGDTDPWFHEVRDRGRCDACGICSLSCPTGALLVKESEKLLSLSHQPATCIGCGLCISLCPQQALQLLVVRDDETVLGDATHTLFECEKLRCSSCGTSFTHLDSHTQLCRACENEEAIRSQWTGEAG
jgi:NAD-dependent dihydropyrimidine dehydrogenase PreA subunit